MDHLVAWMALATSLLCLKKLWSLGAASRESSSDVSSLQAQLRDLRDDMAAQQEIFGRQLVRISQGDRPSLDDIQAGRLFKQISKDDASNMLNQHPDLVVLDVREPHEYAGGHVRDCLHIPVGELEKRWEEIESTSSPIIVYCAAGMRSASACDFLSRQSLQATFFNLEGGVGQWPQELVR